MDVRLGGDLLRIDLIVIFRSSGSSGVDQRPEIGGDLLMDVRLKHELE